MHILKNFAYNISEAIVRDFDMEYKISFSNFIKTCLPSGAEITMLEAPYEKPAICIGDLDGDKALEIVIGYKWQGGAIWSQLNIIQWTPQGYKNLLKNDIYYSKIQVEDMKDINGRDGIYEIALWVHDTGEAYKVEVYRFKNGELIPAKDVYTYYFPRVVAYYKERVKEMPDAAFYWYYLADAQFKAAMYEDALISINKAIDLNLEYPPRDVLIELKEDILNKLKCEDESISLYPASIKTVKGVL